MSWTLFVLAYLGVMVAACVAARGPFRGRAATLTRTLVAGTLLLLLGDSLATQRGLWLIPGPLGIYILGAPVENALVVVAALLNSLLPYLLLRSWDPRPEATDKGRIQSAG